MYEKKVGVAKLLGTRLRQWRKDSGYKIAELAEIIDKYVPRRNKNSK